MEQQNYLVCRNLPIKCHNTQDKMQCLSENTTAWRGFVNYTRTYTEHVMLCNVVARTSTSSNLHPLC